MVGNYAESLDVARHLYYKVSADGTVLAEGKLAPWILGSAEIDVDVRGMQTLEIETRIEKAKAPKTIFLGSPKLLDAAGEEIPFEVQAENVAEASGKNLDYAGGTVSIFGEHHSRSIAAEPADRKKPGMLKIDLKGAARFKATLGGDYPVGGDDIHRKIIATRSTGKEARFLSAVELHEDNPVIKSIQAVGNDEVVVLRRDGSVDRFKIAGLGGRGVSVEMTVELDGKVIAAETAEAMKRVP